MDVWTDITQPNFPKVVVAAQALNYSMNDLKDQDVVTYNVHKILHPH